MWELVSEDRLRAAVGVFRLAGPGHADYRVRLRGIDRGRSYRLTFDNAGQVAEEIDGISLAAGGLVLRLERPLSSELLLLEAARDH